MQSSFTAAYFLSTAVRIIVAIPLLVAAASVAYSLCLLYLASLVKRGLRTAPLDQPVTSFTILVPAHDEEAVIAQTLRSIENLVYPDALVRTIVIADNCTDGTAVISAGYKRATVWERTNNREIGKPCALNWAIERLADAGKSGAKGLDAETDCVVIVDADTLVAPDFLSVMDTAYRNRVGGGEYFAAQGRYDVANPDDNWRTSLMAGALSLVHYVRPLARDAMGLSAGLKGNGMCFSWPVPRDLRWRADSLTEDIEYGLDLIERWELPVRFVPGAVVRAQMPTGREASAGQRRRWEGGRQRVARKRALPMMIAGLFARSRLRFDAAADLLLPALGQTAALIGFSGALLIVAGFIGLSYRSLDCLWVATTAGLVLYVVAGFAVGGAPRSAYAALVRAPFFIVWKIFTLATRRNRKGPVVWERTARNANQAGSDDSTVEDGERS